jgi:hypothetical protein
MSQAEENCLHLRFQIDKKTESVMRQVDFLELLRQSQSYRSLLAQLYVQKSTRRIRDDLITARSRDWSKARITSLDRFRVHKA